MRSPMNSKLELEERKVRSCGRTAGSTNARCIKGHGFWTGAGMKIIRERGDRDDRWIKKMVLARR
jgi:hypothetical protein